MNRKTFLATIAAILSAPFVVKSEPKKPTLEDWIKANPVLAQEALEAAIKNALTVRLQQRIEGDELVYMVEPRYRKNGKTNAISQIQEEMMKWQPQGDDVVCTVNPNLPPTWRPEWK
jgi:hypothetical protein